MSSGQLSAGSAQTALKTINGQSRAAAEVTLTITNRYAGDNYVVHASLDEQFGDFVATSNLTAWKRVYVETAFMPMEGADAGNPTSQPDQLQQIDDVLSGYTLKLPASQPEWNRNWAGEELLGWLQPNATILVFSNEDAARKRGEIVQVAATTQQDGLVVSLKPDTTRTIVRAHSASQSNPCRVSTIGAHGFSDGTAIHVQAMQGMTELVGHDYFVKNTDDCHIDLYADSNLQTPVDSRNFTASTPSWGGSWLVTVNARQNPLLYRQLPVNEVMGRPYGVTVHIARCTQDGVYPSLYVPNVDGVLNEQRAAGKGYPLDAFLEVMAPRDKDCYCPFRWHLFPGLRWGRPGGVDQQPIIDKARELTIKWFGHANKRPDTMDLNQQQTEIRENVWTGAENYFHLLSGGRMTGASGFGPPSMNSAFAVGRYSEASILAHEFGHQFDQWHEFPKPPTNNAHNHCYMPDDPNLECVMFWAPMIEDPQHSGQFLYRQNKWYCAKHANLGWEGAGWKWYSYRDVGDNR